MKCVGSGKEENKDRLFVSTVGSGVKDRRLIDLTSTWLSLAEMKSLFLFSFYPEPIHFTVILDVIGGL